MVPTQQTNNLNRQKVAVGSESESDSFPYQFHDQSLMQLFDHGLHHSESVEELLVYLSKLVGQQSECNALWASQATENNGKFSPPFVLSDKDSELVWDIVEDQATVMINRVANSGQICSSPVRGSNHCELIVSPVMVPGSKAKKIQLMLIGCFSTKFQSSLRQQWLLGMAGQTVTRWFEMRKSESELTKNSGLNDTISLIFAIGQTKSTDEMGRTLVNHLKKMTGAVQVAIGLGNDASTQKLTAVSGVEDLNPHLENNIVVAKALASGFDVEEPIVYSPKNPDKSPGHIPLEAYCQSNNSNACCITPLITATGLQVGNILTSLNQVSEFDCEKHGDYMRQLSVMIAGHLEVVNRANRSLRQVVKDRWSEFSNSTWSRYLWIGAAILALIAIVPLPYQVACQCEIQPTKRRFVAAPYDGILEESLVENGEIVQQGQIIARLDGRQLRIELSGLRAELDGARKKRDSALAQGDVANSQIARSEMERFQSKIELIEEQLNHLEVQAPMGGVVVNGDLEKVEGAPLEMGQTLFEIAPLDEMVAEVGIPESEIPYVSPGMDVKIKLNAFPFQTWQGQITNIYPSAELVENESVFIAQVKLANDQQKLRPGLKGYAKVKSDYAPLAWSYFHQPWESVRYWMVW
ncbi:MAG: efflux RND transporter periplasmic adaptor subunit [Planctomycetota bacterium]